MNSAFHHRHYMPEGLTDSESIKSEGIAALYLNIITVLSASVICKMLILMPEVPDVL